MNRDFKGVWIPKEIWLNPDFSGEQKLIVGSLVYFADWVDAETLANFIGMKKGRLIRLMSETDFIIKKKIVRDNRLLTVYQYYYFDSILGGE